MDERQREEEAIQEQKSDFAYRLLWIMLILAVVASGAAKVKESYEEKHNVTAVTETATEWDGCCPVCGTVIPDGIDKSAYLYCYSCGTAME